MTTPLSCDIQPDHLAIVRAILQHHVPAAQVCVFGSRVTGRARPYSDLDLVVMTPMSLGTQAALREAFAESDLPWKVDLLDWTRTPPEFRQAIRQQLTTIQSGSDPVLSLTT